MTETVTDNYGLTAQASQPAPTVDSAPYVTFSMPARILAGQSVTFNASGSRAALPGTALDYSWDWGDGYPDDHGANPVAKQTFSDPGIYNVTLTATDHYGFGESRTVNVRVRGAIASSDARADFRNMLAFHSRFSAAWLGSTAPRPNPSPACPQALISDFSPAPCWAQFLYRGTWYLLEGTVSPRQDENAASGSLSNTGSVVWSRQWTRRWQPSSKGCARGIPGRLSSNDGSCYGQVIRVFFGSSRHIAFHFKRHVYVLGAGSGAFPQWTTLNCSWRQHTYECTNSFGDGFRWQRLPGSSWNFGDDPHRLTVTR